MTDDVGFGASSTFGGPVPTPTLDRLAHSGLRYNQFHTTAMCSPTRAALLTGRNHHTCATGVIMEFGTGYPGYNTLIPKSCGTVAEILKQNGYNTSFFGKCHNVPDWHTSQAGPFDRWPTNQGFEYFYGFLGAETSQWDPAIFEGTKPLQKPRGDKTLSFRPRPGRPCHRLDPPAARAGPGKVFLSPITRRALRMPRTMRRRSGSPASRAVSTRGGTRFAKRLSSGRRSWGLCPPIPC